MWSFVLSTLGGSALGELTNAAERKLELALNRTPTASFTVRLDHPQADELLAMDALLKVYQDTSVGKQLRFCGPLTTAEEVGSESDQGSIAMVAAGAFWRLQKRLIGKSNTGYTNGSVGSPVDFGAIAQALIERVNAASGNVDAGGDTGIRIGSITPSASGYVGPWYYKPVGEAIAEMAATLDGFDFEVAPTEPTLDADGVAIGTFTAGAFLGTDRSADAIFEFGDGNVKAYRRQISAEGLLNYGYSLPQGFPENATGAVQFATDPDSIVARGRYEDVVSADLADNLRLALVQEHVRIRRAPRQQITFDPGLAGPEFGVAYEVGDLVRGRAKVSGEPRFDAIFRCYGASFTIDDVGRATPSLTLIPDTTGT